jgi:hypothetical protein
LFTIASQYEDQSGTLLGSSYRIVAEHEEQAIEMCKAFERKCGVKTVDVIVQAYERDEKLRDELLGIVHRSPIVVEK